MIKLLLLGGTGLVGSRVLQLLKNFEIVAPTVQELDVTNQKQIKDQIPIIRPDLFLYSAGFTNVDLAEEKKEECFLLNVKAIEFLTLEATKLQIPFYYLSTDYVFDGKKEDKPYTEGDQPDPVDEVYAKSKRAGELVALSNKINGVIRLIMPFSAAHAFKMDIGRLVVDKLKKGEKISAVYNQKINPIFVDNLVYGLGKIMEKRATGIYHLAATSFTSPYDFMKEIAKQFKLPSNFIEKVSFETYTKTRPAKRPQHTWLDTQKFQKEFGTNILHTIEEEVAIFKSQIDAREGIS